MSLNVADLVGTLKIDKTQWNQGLRGLPGEVGKQGGLASRMAAAQGSQIAGSLGDSFKRTLVGGAIMGAVSGVTQAATNALMNGIGVAFQAAKASIFDFNSTLEQADIGFTTMLGSAKKSREFLDQLKSFAKATPFEFQGLVKNAQSLMGMGVAAKDVIPTLTALGDSTASVGGDANMLNNTILAWGQTVSKGTLSMDNMNQLLQGGMPQALKVLAAQYGVTTGKMVEMISSGKLQASDALPKLIKGIEHGTSATAALGGMMDKQSQTFSGAWSNITDSVQQAMASAFLPLFQEASKGFQGLATWLSSPDFQKWSTQATVALKGAISWLKETGSAAATYLKPIIDNLVDQGKTLGGTLKSAWGAIGPPIKAAADAMFGFLGPFLQSKDAIQILGPILAGLVIGIGAYRTVVMLAAAQQWLLNAAMTANPIGLIVAAIAALVAGLVWFFTQTKVGQDIWAGFVGFLSDAWNGFVGWFQDAIGNVAKFLQQWGPLILAAVLPVVGIPLLIIQHWGDIVKFFQALPGNIGKLLAGIGQWLLDAGMNLLRGLATGIAMGVIAVHYFFTKFPSDLAGWIGNAAVWLVTKGKDILTGLVNGVKNGYTAVVAWFTALPRNVAGFFSDVATWLTTKGKDLLVGFAKGYIGFWRDVAAWFLSLPGKIADFFSGIGTWLTTKGKDLLVGFALGYVGFWKDVGAWFLSLPGKIGGFFSGAGRWLYESGVNVVQGLLNGVKSLAGTVGSFFLSLLPSWIVGPFKAALGIKSPSRVFMQLGKYIGQGLGIGIASSKQDIADSMAKTIQYVKDGYDKLADAAKAAQKKLTAAQRRYNDMSAKQRNSATGRNLADTIADYKSTIAANKGNKGGKAEKRLLDSLKSDNTALAAAAKRRDKIAKDLETANDNLQAARDEMKQFASDTRDSAVSAGNVVDAWGDAMQKISDAANGNGDGSAPTSALSGMIAHLQDEVNKTQEFRKILADLKAQGLDDTTYRQLVAAGADTGLQVAQDIANGGTAAVQQIAGLQGQLAAAGTALGTDTSQVLYGAGVAMKQGIVDGLTADMSNVTTAINVLKDDVVLKLYNAGLATKGQAKSAGINMLAGISEGLKDGKANSDLDKAIKALGTKMTKTLKKQLGIKSPSTVFANEVGRFIPPGIVKGIDATSGALDARISDLVTIPAVQGLGGATGGRGGALPGQSYSQSATVAIYGNVGWDPEEVANRMRDTQNTQAALAGLDALVPA